MIFEDRLGVFEEDAAILETIANQYGQDSRQNLAVRHAAIALWYVLTQGHQEFQKYIERFDGPLSDEQKAHLRQMGIDPDTEVD